MTRLEARKAVESAGGISQAAKALGVGRNFIRYALKREPKNIRESIAECYALQILTSKRMGLHNG